MTKEGLVVKVYKQAGQWACFQFEDKRSKTKLTAKGRVTDLLMPGMKIEITGKYVEDPKYGLQIDITSLKPMSSVTATYLTKFVNGIGPALANEIVKTLGEDCVEKIKKDHSLLLKVKGIKEKKFKAITKSLEHADNTDLYYSILGFFKNDITVNQISKIVEVCEEKKTSLKKIKENPYWLISHVEGFGFKKVDKLALSAGIGLFSKERIGSAIVYVLQQMSQLEGHCYSDMEKLCEEVAKLVLVSPENFSQRMMNSFRKIVDEGDEAKIENFLKKNDTDGSLRKWKDDYYQMIDVMSSALVDDVNEGLVVVEDERIYWIDLYKAEKYAAEAIRRMAFEKVVRPVSIRKIAKAIKELEEDEECELSDEQKAAIENSLTNKLSVITGGPGRGKTTIIKAIIKAWDKKDDVILLAPTGRAAKRMAETSGHEASTIHRYKNSIRHVDKEAETVTWDMPKKKLIIVDETSMIGIKLAKDVLEIAKDCNLIFVGDIDQLASIEPGTFMKDLIECRCVTVSRLTHGFRNAGSIAINSDLINKGKSLKYFTLDKSTQFIEAYEDDIINVIIEKYKDALKRYDPKDIGILTPMRSRGSGCVDLINEEFRKKVNPATSSNPQNESGYLVHDRVMHARNNYQKETENRAGKEEHGVFNGDCGTVTKIDYDEMEVTVLFDDDRIGKFSYEEMRTDFVPAFATTIHKSQGSEYKMVIAVITSQHAFFLKRNLVYTAFTRAKKELVIVGDAKAVSIASRNIDDKKRNTYLRERIIAK